MTGTGGEECFDDLILIDLSFFSGTCLMFRRYMRVSESSGATLFCDARLDRAGSNEEAEPKDTAPPSDGADPKFKLEDETRPTADDGYIGWV